MAHGNPGRFAGRCEECRRAIREYERVVIESEPQVVWCTRCEAEAAYYADPQNVAYERARAAGWSD
jgi:hypothetical protein